LIANEKSDDGSIVEVQDFIASYPEPLGYVYAYAYDDVDTIVIYAYSGVNAFPMSVAMSFSNSETGASYGSTSAVLEGEIDDDTLILAVGSTEVTFDFPTSATNIVGTAVVTDALGQVYEWEVLVLQFGQTD